MFLSAALHYTCIALLFTINEPGWQKGRPTVIDPDGWMDGGWRWIHRKGFRVYTVLGGLSNHLGAPLKGFHLKNPPKITSCDYFSAC